MLRSTLTRFNLSTGVAFVLVALGVACGQSNSANTGAPANDADGGLLPDGGVAGNGGLLPDGGPAGDDTNAADGESSTPPAVVSTIPLSAAVDVALNGNVSAIFNEPMDGASLSTTTFTVTSNAVALSGTVIYANSTAVFWPAAHFASNSVFTATVTTGAMSASGIAMVSTYAWNFTTGTTVAPGLPVNLGTASNYVILSKAGISTVPDSTITGNMGVSPVAASYITGFSLTADATNEFSTTPQVTGRVYAADYKPPTPSNLTTAVLDMETAFTDAAGRAPDVTELGAGNIGGLTLVPGVYKWGTGLLIPTNVTLAGSATDVWIFQVAEDLTMSSAAEVVLSGGALSKNVFWQVSGMVDLGTTAQFEGVVLTHTAATLQTGASINGRLLAQTAVTLAGNTVVQPAP